MMTMGLWVAVLGSVLAFWPWAAEPFMMPKLAAVLLGALLAHLGLAARGKTLGTRLAWPVLAWALALGAACYASADPWVSVLGARASGSGSLISCAGLVLIITAAARAGEAPEFLYQPVAIAGALAGAYAVAQLYGCDPLWISSAAIFSGRSIGTMGGPIYLGPALAVCLPAALDMAEKRPLWTIPAAAIFAGVLASGTRAAVGAAVVGCLVMAVRRGALRARVAGWMAAGAVALAVVSRAGALMSDVGRLEIWKIAARAAMDRPLTGWGPDTFGLVMRRYISPEFLATFKLDTITQTHAHNLVMQTAYSSGLLGLAALGISAWCLWGAVRRAEDVHAPALGTLAVVLLCASTNPMPLAAWVVAGVLVAPLFAIPVFSWAPIRSSLACASLAALLLWPAARMIKAEVVAYRGMVEWNNRRGLDAGYAFNRAAALAPWDMEHVGHQLDAARSIAIWMPAAPARELAMDALKMAQENASRHPQDPKAYEALAAQESLLALLDARAGLSVEPRQTAAARWLDVAHGMAPTYSPIAWRARMVKLGMGRAG